MTNKQCRRTGDPPADARTTQLDLPRLGLRRRARRGLLHPDPDL
nr:hypothetical protein [Mesorhizobium sp.]